MGALFLPESRNYARNASSVTISTAGHPDTRRLVDGRLAPLWSSTSWAAAVDIYISFSSSVSLDFVSIHDLRLAAGHMVSMRVVAGSHDETYSVPPSLQESVLRGMWARFPSVNIPALGNVFLRLLFSAGTEYSLGEIAAGSAIELPYSIRGAVRGNEPLIVENGDSRVMAAQARVSLDMEFPPSVEDHLERIVSVSGGPLRPLIVVPSSDQPEVIHGHLRAGQQSREDLRIYTRFLSLVESPRALR